MARPRIICHMITSVDSKITGPFLTEAKNQPLLDDYYRIHREYQADGFLCGRVTMQEGFLPHPKPTETTGAPLDRSDYVAGQADFYAVAIDPSGKLWWEAPTLSDDDAGYDGARIIEVLRTDVPDAFLHHLRAHGVSYLFAGDTALNLHMVATKLRALFGIKTLLLEGGGVVNGSFAQAGLIDEISLVVVPQIESSTTAASLFQSYDGSAGEDRFTLHKVSPLKNGGSWQVYQKEKKEN